MPETDKPPPGPNPQQLREAATREARLAAALRANLKRRKGAVKSRDQKTDIERIVMPGRGD